MTDAGFAPVRTLSETRRAHAVFLGHVAVFAIGATSSIQLANVHGDHAVGGVPAARARHSC